MNDALSFFETAHLAFEAAAKNAGRVEHGLRVAGRPVRLCIAGSGMSVMLPAFSHLLQGEGANMHSPSLTICLWDSTTTGTPMPPPPWRNEHYHLRGEIAGYNDERVRTVFDLGRVMLYMIDLQRGLALAWTQDAAQVPAYEIAAPLLPIWNAWLSQHGDMLVHAAAVGRPEGGVLLVGKGGSGKSTTALACLNSPLGYLADDSCIVTGGDVPRIYSLFCTGRVYRDNLQRLPHMQAAFDHSGAEADKAICHVPSHFAGKLLRECPLRAILAPVIAHQPATQVLPAPAASMLKALAPSTLFHLGAVAGASEMQRMASLIRRVPGYQLRLGETISGIPLVIDQFLKDIVLQPV